VEPTLMQLAVAEAYKISIGEVFHMWETTMVHELDPARPGYFSNKLALDAEGKPQRRFTPAYIKKLEDHPLIGPIYERLLAEAKRR